MQLKQFLRYVPWAARIRVTRRRIHRFIASAFPGIGVKLSSIGNASIDFQLASDTLNGVAEVVLLPNPANPSEVSMIFRLTAVALLLSAM